MERETDEYFLSVVRIPKTGKTQWWWTPYGDDEKYKEAYLAEANVSEGGWYGGRKWLTNPLIKEIEKRWAIRSYDSRADKVMSCPDTSDDLRVILQQIDDSYDLSAGISQCGGCMYFAALGGNYGLCWNEKSIHDGSVTFEHGGCIEHSIIQEKITQGEI